MLEINPQNGNMGNGHQSAADAGRNVAEVLRRSTQAAQQTARATSDVLARAGSMTAEVTQRNSEAGTEALKRVGDAASETLRQSAEVFAKTQRELAHTTAEQFGQTSRRVAQAARGTNEDLRILMTLPSAANEGVRELQRSMTGLAETMMRANLQAAREMFQFANPGALMELQQRLMRVHIDTLINGAAALVRATSVTAEETLSRLDQQIKQRQHAGAEQRHQVSEQYMAS